MNATDVFKAELVAAIEKLPEDRYTHLLALYVFLRYAQKLRLTCSSADKMGLRVSQMALADEELLKELTDLAK